MNVELLERARSEPSARSVTDSAIVGLRGPRRRTGRIARAGALLVLLSVAYYLFNLAEVVATGRANQTRPTGAIVVLGAAQYNGRPSAQLAARLDHAVTLFRERVAPVVMVTGGNQVGDNFTEAEASRNYLVASGVPAHAILAEDQGTNTYNSLRRAASVLEVHGIDDVVLVTDPFHAERSELIAGEVGLRAGSSPTPTSVLSASHQFRRELVEAAGVGVGRLIGFGRLSTLTG